VRTLTSFPGSLALGCRAVQKVSIAREELGLPYEAIRINPMQPGGGSGIEKHNINGKIPPSMIRTCSSTART
jgi:hypothetical protein